MHTTYKQFSIVALLTFLLLSATSCDWKNEYELPESPITVAEALLPVTQQALSLFSGFELAHKTGIITQQISGVEGAFQPMDNYRILREDMDAAWEQCYLYTLSNLNTIRKIAIENQLGKYEGISSIMMAAALGVATDVWGDMPFSESFLRQGILRPKFDSQEDIYSIIFGYLHRGITLLKEYGNQASPGDQDLYFAGNASKWIRYAEFLQLRYTLHLSGRLPAAQLLDSIRGGGFVSSGERASLHYLAFENLVNPWFHRLTAESHGIRAGKTIVNLMNETNDPRLPYYFLPAVDDKFRGAEPGMADGAANRLSGFVLDMGAHIVLGSYTEQRFIESEIYFRNGMLSQAEASFAEAVRSSLIERESFSQQWLDQYLASSKPLSLQHIIEAKYVALFLQTEVWADWRRTGFPNLDPAFNNTTQDQIPVRLPYPQSEYLYNGANVPQVYDLTTPVWWHAGQ